jgi:hypothetical protein
MKGAGVIVLVLAASAVPVQADVNLGGAIVDDKTAYWWIVDVPKKLLGQEVQGAFVRHDGYIARTAGIEYVQGPIEGYDPKSRCFKVSIELVHQGKIIDRQTRLDCR